MPRHADLVAIRQDEIRAVPELLDEAEDVVPASAIEAGRVLAQLVPTSATRIDSPGSLVSSQADIDRRAHELREDGHGGREVHPPELQVRAHGEVEELIAMEAVG